MASVKLKIKVSLLFFITTLSGNAVSEYNSQKIAGALGRYLGMLYTSDFIMSSECAYAAKKVPILSNLPKVEEIIKKLPNILSHKDYSDLIVDYKKMKPRLRKGGQEVFEMLYEGLIKIGHDKKLPAV